MAFDDTRLPVNIEKGAVGGPQFRTTVVTLAGGAEQRNQNWSRVRAMYDIAYGVDHAASYQALVNFFYGCRGKARGFRFKDWADYKATDVVLGVGTGTLATFQVIKVYDDGVNAYSRKITRLVAGTLVVKVAGVVKATPADYSVNSAGLITFAGGHIPVAAAQVTASFEFDVPVRFDTDHLPVMIENEDAIQITSVQLLEIIE